MTHTNTKRIAAISLVAVLCLSSLAMLAPAASAYYLYGADNDTPRVQGERDVLFALDFEAEDIGPFKTAIESIISRT